MGVFEPGSMRPKGLSAKEEREMIKRGWKALREGKITLVGTKKPQEPAGG